MWLRKGLCLGLLAVAAWQGGGALWLEAKAKLAQRLIADAWRESLAQQQPVKPWGWADTWPVAQLAHPRSGTQLMVLAGADGTSLAFGPGWLQASAAPGMAGTTVIAGHRDTHFRFLGQLQYGDRLELTDRVGRVHTFRVQFQTVADSREGPLWADPGTDQLLLVTCYPLQAIDAGGPQRLVVTALPELNDRSLTL